jgi:Protein kinase domain
MGRVYLAEQRMGHALRNVAIKVLTTSLADQLAVTRFYRECETVVQLTHPNTIRFYDFGSVEVPRPDGGTEKRLYIAMEYVDGRPLSHAIRKGPLPLPEVERLIVQIGGALHEAHKRGIIHRDLKPDNVLLAPSDEGEIAKVCDFGIAKQSDAAHQITAQGTIIGTPAYMSPEQITGASVDVRSDVYALGLMTFEMLTGSRAFVASTPLEWATAHLTAEPRSFDEFAATRELPQRARDAVLHALTKDVSSRTPSVRAFMDEFLSYSGPRSVPAPALASPAEPPKPISRRRWRVLPVVAGIMFLLLPGVLGAALWLRTRAPVDAEADAGVGPSDAGPTGSWLEILQYEDRAEDAPLALGAPDGRCAKIHDRGTITLELTPGARIATDGSAAPDVQVILVGEESSPYRVDVGVERHQYTTVAQGLLRSLPLDVDQYGISAFRYVRIKNRSGVGDVCVDAVVAFHGNAR